ncbi:MAG: hypothetical protein H8E24_00740, partial [Verrucomicrobia bacterium]|nr:hypothetical protein [Verrucomicrobiota bacterium]
MSRYIMPLCLTFIWATAGFSAPTSEEDDLLNDLEAELQRSLKVEKSTKSSPAVEELSPEGIDRLYQEAADFYAKGKYHEAKASMTRAYAAFERLAVKDKD